ncbi:hypothetical protein K491DRAFT_449659 [Lophiostoma macrostomum CBS 122681]|uniref:Uncharacterized protein n=1 Tax=Lophiostoma macrostomum CBS 122681 TaxID=1314788 RepID=A0A6A6TQY1_9PLEO|nr:hypothetical protein K491DRAFT_449659 [Lophiostoma macrostomum CBS 122681]
MEHFAPHMRAVFEGWYSKFDLPSGAHLAIIICTVPKASQRPPHMVSFTYYPKSGSPIYQREHWVSELHRVKLNSTHAFELRVPGIGFMKVDADSTTTYDLKCEDWTLKGRTTGRKPWNTRCSTPEGLLVRLPLPLHWHVHSLASPCDFTLSIPSIDMPPEDRQGEASVHQEKNWASSFPSAHTWVQAHSPETNTTINLTGGKILGMTAYMIAYRSPDLEVLFRPPFSVAFLGISPFMSVEVDYENRAFAISVSGIWKRIEVRAKAPADKETWFGLGSPFPEGHRRNFCSESFLATVEVVVSERGWWGSWQERREG